MTSLALSRSLRIVRLAALAGCLAAPAVSGAAEEPGLASPAQTCAAVTASRWQPPSGRHLAAMPPAARPDKGIPHIDRVHGSCIVRVTDHAQEPPRGGIGSESARRAAFNADESRLLLLAQDGRWHLYDAQSLAHRAELPALGADAEPQWHPKRPELLHHLPPRGTALQLLELDLRSGRSRVAADFATRVKRLWPTARALATAGGSPSLDGRYWAFLVEDAARGGLGVFTWDLQEDRILAHLDLAAQRRDRPGQLGMSPSGSHVVLSWHDGATAFTRELAQPRRLPGSAASFDLALAADGEDAYVAVDAAASGAPLFMLRLRSGERTELFATQASGTGTALQVSGLAHRRPGWVLVSTHADHGKGGRQWLHRRLMAVELKAGGRITHLAFHRHRDARRRGEPHATVNRDFTRVLFNSGWGGPDADAYLVVLPRDALSR
ncbi:hypothetical protein [Caldimonas tepidiphila]|uniref:hypothetical protein n=1 Tax=Caldimonas tepidiphila TaxID=2315841 RepID=UPI000E5A2D7A|nr:hypothetical protein [Caldimonas tepidiphila]